MLYRTATSPDAPTGTLHLAAIGGAPAPAIFPAALPSAVIGEMSPDGRWLVYQSREGSDRDEIQVRRFAISIASFTLPAALFTLWEHT